MNKSQELKCVFYEVVSLVDYFSLSTYLHALSLSFFFQIIDFFSPSSIKYLHYVGRLLSLAI